MTGTIIAATDGSALSNPGPAGWAWVIDENNWDTGGWAHASNNQAELVAVLQLLKATAPLQTRLVIQCDSRYVIDSLTKWVHGWKKNNWKKADGKPVLNKELMQQLDSALADRDVTFEWVKAHAGHQLNEAADTIAQRTANAYKLGQGTSQSGPGITKNILG